MPTMCKNCRERPSKCKGSLCGRCFRAEHGVSSKQLAKVEGGSGVSEQLRAIRAAMRWNKSSSPKHPLIRFYVELRETNPREISQQWDRLEREHRQAAPAVSQSSPVILPGSDPSPPVAAPVLVRDDGYDPSTDTVTPKLLGMIERWLAGCKARAEAKAAGRLEPGPDLDDETDIPG